jgi:phytoene desaturase
VAQLVNGSVTDSRVRQAMSFHPLLIGGNPFHTPAIYALIPELERRWGVWYPMGGMGALVQALARLFTTSGGELRCGCDTGEVLVHDATGRAAGVRLKSGECIPAHAVVSNADPLWTIRELLPSRYRRITTTVRLGRLRYGMSAFVLCFGTNRQYRDRAHHEILMGPRYRPLLDDIFRHRRLAPDFSLYLHRPTATDSTMAPAGCDTWYALAPVPNLGGAVDWKVAGNALRDRIVEYLEARHLPGLRSHIVCERRIDPTFYRDALNAPLGSAFSVEPRLSQSAWFRPHHASRDVPGLYFVGAGTHPGAGIPGVLGSARIVADMIGRNAPTDRRAVAPTTRESPRRRPMGEPGKSRPAAAGRVSGPVPQH